MHVRRRRVVASVRCVRRVRRHAATDPRACCADASRAVARRRGASSRGASVPRDIEPPSPVTTAAWTLPAERLRRARAGCESPERRDESVVRRRRCAGDAPDCRRPLSAAMSDVTCLTATAAAWREPPGRRGVARIRQPDRRRRSSRALTSSRGPAWHPDGGNAPGDRRDARRGVAARSTGRRCRGGARAAVGRTGARAVPRRRARRGGSEASTGCADGEHGSSAAIRSAGPL